jgi:uncharacterized protein YciI
MELPDDIRERLGLVPVWLVLMRDTEAMDRDDAVAMEEHLRWQLRLEDERILLAAGPLNWGTSTPGPAGAVGMYVLAAGSHAEAERIAATEPFELRGQREHELHAWLLNEGVAVPLARELMS